MALLLNIKMRLTERLASIERRGARPAYFGSLLIISIASIWLAACASYLSGHSNPEDIASSICKRVDEIDRGMLLEELSIEEINHHLDRLELEIGNTRGEIVDAVERFIHALRDILATGAYDYPTLQILNYLDTYEHMEMHVEGFEALENVRHECEYIDKEWIGDEPAVKVHFSQSGIEAGKYSVDELVEHGRNLFTASFNALDGAGRPNLTGTSEFRRRRKSPDNFNRISGPDANACSGCHTIPVIGGGGDNIANVFALSQRFEFVDFADQMEFDFRSDLQDRLQYENEDEETLNIKNVGNERNTVGMFGSGFVELLAREMTRELQAIEQEAVAEAKKSGWPARRKLIAKGVDFGAITAHPNGFVYTSEVDGVDGDLIVRPFIQKGVTTSLREFTNDALIHHHGMQNYERAGAYVDDDGDGVVNEITPGDVTALVAFMATLPAPIPQVPTDKDRAQIVERGRERFEAIGCAECHIPALPLESLVFTEPGEFNFGRDLRPATVENVLSIDLSDYSGEFERDEDGNYMIPIFSDLKRHEMGETLDNEEVIQDGVPTDEWMTRRLWGFASEPPFLHHGRATLISDAIIAHEGEAQPQKERFLALSDDDRDAIIAFLKTLTISIDE